MNTFVFFRYGANFDRVARKSKTNGIIGCEMAVSFCKDETDCAHCFNITGRFSKR
uniref:Orf8 n=1 Tax=Serratia marcescens TaxID=615 RepID=A0A7S6YKB0_SERMA|nr:Orf8 [Serratia marcescens]